MKQSAKITLCCALVAAIIITGYVNYKANHKELNTETETIMAEEMVEQVDVQQTQQVDFAQYKQQRDVTRAQELEYLDSIINSGEVEQNLVNEAADQKMQITKAMETELILEGLLKSSGYNDSLVTCSEGSVNVVVSKQSLSEDEALKIFEIVRSETGESAQNIKIIPQA